MPEEKEEKPGIKWKPPKHFLEDDDEPEEEWGMEHCRILYLVSKFAKTALTAEEKESWIRFLPLTVLLYEGIVAGVIDLDYAPISCLVSHGGRSRRVWMNVSQEGKSVVDDLREGRMINGLKLSTEDFQPVTAFQVSAKGIEFLKILPTQIMNEVDKFLHADDGSLFRAEYMPDRTAFELRTDTGVKRECLVTDTEDVSYVSSPYLPACLRKESRFMIPFSTNAHRSHESAAGTSDIRDELDEAIVLGRVMVMVGEWIPFGANQIVALNERLGALDRCQGGLFTSMIDENPTDTQFEVPPGLTSVKILDFDFVRFINFEAEINYPEEEGIVQVENFGMHLNVDGTIVYGIFVEAILDRQKDDVSLDLLSRLLVDLHQDSSTIMDDLLSQYQRGLLDMLFMGDTMMRNKFNCIVAEQIKPKVDGEDYMDKGDFENELKQVLGDLRACHDLGDKDVIMMGQDGILLCGPHCMQHEHMLFVYLSLLTREIFIRNFFIRTFVLDDLLSTVRALIGDYQKDPNHIQTIRAKLNVGSRDVILLKEVLEYLRESLLDLTIPPMPDDLNGKRLFKVLEPEGMKHDTMLRCTDLDKLVEGAHHQLMTLQQMTDVINTKQLEDVFKNVESNTKFLVGASAANERSSASLEVMQVILAGSFAFDIVDRLSGGTLNIAVPNWVDTMIVDTVIRTPGLWWILNMCWLVLVCSLLIKLMNKLGAMAQGYISLRCSVNRKINVVALEAHLLTKKIKTIDTVHETTTKLKKAQWVEDDARLWMGAPPEVEVVYDEQYEWMLSALFSFDGKKTKMDERKLMEIFLEDLKRHNVLTDTSPIVDFKKE
jgi:WD repeat-containing protein 35